MTAPSPLERGAEWRADAIARHPDRYDRDELLVDDLHDVLLEARQEYLATGPKVAPLLAAALHPKLLALVARGIAPVLRALVDRTVAARLEPTPTDSDDVVDAAIYGSPGRPGDRVRVRLFSDAAAGWHTGAIVDADGELVVEATGGYAVPPEKCAGCSSPICPDCQPPRTAVLAQPAGPDYPMPDPASPRDLWIVVCERDGNCATCGEPIETDAPIEVGDLRGTRLPGRWSCPNGCSPDGMPVQVWSELVAETSRCPLVGCAAPGDIEYGSEEVPNGQYVERVPTRYRRCGGGHDNSGQRVKP